MAIFFILFFKLVKYCVCIDFGVCVCVCVCVCVSVCDFLYYFNIVYFGEIQHVDNKNKKHETNMNLFPPKGQK